MERDARLIADALAVSMPGEPSAGDLVAYARDASALPVADRERVERYLAAAPAHRDRYRALAPSDWKLVGSCLCGEVQYQVRGPLPPIGHCHCRRCRKAHGAAFGSFAIVDAAAMSWVRGGALLTRFGGTGDNVVSFCSRCGTTLTGGARPGRIALAVATLDVDPAVRPAVHAAVTERVPWFDITDEVPQLAGQFEGLPEPAVGEPLTE